jgi:DNA-binding CsgD family transcriptional regulator
MNPLSDQQCIQYARFAQAAVLVDDAAAFRLLIQDHIQPMLPHGRLLAIVGQLTFDHLKIVRHTSINYPPWVIEQIPSSINIKERPAVARWLGQRSPLVIDVEQDHDWLSERERLEIDAFGMGRLAIHGVPDLSVHMASYFSFAQVSVDLPRELIHHTLTLICPLLHVALTRVRDIHQDEHTLQARLTTIERELLTWLAAGRSNAEIAQLRERSPSTVRNQLETLYGKLGVSNRAEAVAMALTQRDASGRYLGI